MSGRGRGDIRWRSIGSITGAEGAMAAGEIAVLATGAGMLEELAEIDESP